MKKLPRTERGVSESVQYALIWPLIMLTTLGIIESGIWLHSRNAALRAAIAAADTARGTYSSSGNAEAVAQAIAQSGGLRQISVAVDRSPTSVTVVVNAQAALILDLGLGALTETASAPVERVSQP
jgi:Flp pilus assembly protein TadG